MNIIICGYGKMGRLIESTAINGGHVITAVIDPVVKETVGAGGIKIYKTFESAVDDKKNAHVIIDFTHPNTVLENITKYAKAKIPALIGTTGWYDNVDEVKKIAAQNQSAILYSSNFSSGVNLFYDIAEYAAKKIDGFAEYDVGGWEAHHNKKADSPSGTAKTLVSRVLKVMSRKKKAAWQTLEDRAPAGDELHFASIRAGSIAGTHTLIFDSPSDTIEITHRARNREGFALGALRSAAWLVEKAKTCSGVFTLDDVN